MEFWDVLVQFVTWFWDVFMNLDQHLVEWSQMLGPWLYAVLFAIIFAETGLVVTPILPGDSLLFAAGALCALEGSALSLVPMMALLIVAAILGDAVNYSAGRWIGPKVFNKESSLLFKRDHLLKTQAFYEKHGGKTIILARFIPIVRTFAPFVAGIGKMSYSRFAMFNVSGAIFWIISFSVLGYAFGNMPVVKKNFQFVMIGIVLVSVLPMVYEYLASRKSRARANSTRAPVREN